MSPGRSIGFSHPLNRILMRGNEHDGHSRHLANPPLQILVASSHYVDTMLTDPFDQTVISIGSLVLTFQHLEAGVLGDLEGDPVLHSKLLQLCHDALSHIRDAYIIDEVHLPSRQSIEALKMSSLFWMEKLMKLVSSRMR